MRSPPPLSYFLDNADELLGTTSSPEWLTSFHCLSESTASSSSIPPDATLPLFNLSPQPFHPAMDLNGFHFSSSWLVDQREGKGVEERGAVCSTRSVDVLDAQSLTQEFRSRLPPPPPIFDDTQLNFGIFSQPLELSSPSISPLPPLSPQEFQFLDFSWTFETEEPRPDASIRTDQSQPSSDSEKVTAKRTRVSVDSSSSGETNLGCWADSDEQRRKQRRRETNRKSAKAFRSRRKGKLDELKRETELKDIKVAKLREEVEALRRDKVRLLEQKVAGSRELATSRHC